jgi:hypothetical protein
MLLMQSQKWVKVFAVIKGTVMYVFTDESKVNLRSVGSLGCLALCQVRPSLSLVYV